MSAISLSTVFVTFFAVVGPPKVLLAFAQLSQRRTPAELRKLTLVSSLVAAVVGLVLAYSADFMAALFHISDQSLQLAGGVIFFIYAVALVLGVHLGGGKDQGHLANPLADGIRELLLPYVASPLAITALLVESLTRDTLGWHSTVAAMYVAVIAVDCLCVLLLAPLLRASRRTSLEVLSRLLGLLLAAVGVEMFLYGLESLGVHLAEPRNGY
ncbi:MarC family protein [Kitasatospora phosalacinea]|uniref:MarC family protein n=1 Tax=Kitasatospora phosalacinea TaxID=2065 RepID=UPI000524019F|nr:MarC family protein [Kitasatospora phosalacinea]